MTLSNCKIIDGNHNTSKGKLLLTVDFLEGQPKAGEYIYLKEQYFSVHFYKIEKVNRPLLGKHHELTIKFKEPEWMWKERILKHITEENDTAICGISVEDFYNLNSQQKLEYVTKLIDFISHDHVGSFLKENLKFANKLILKEREGDVGLTKFGGLPIGSSDIYFPKDIDGKSAIFICQVHISEFNQWFQATKEFNGTGVLYFFATIKKEDEYESFDDIRVLYSDKIENIKELSLPDDINDYGVLEEKDLMVAEEVNIPPNETSLWGLTEIANDERNRYWYIEAIISQLNVFSASKILGHPNQIQGCVLLESELKSTQKGWYDPNGFENDKFQELIKELEPQAVRWRHLFDIDPLDDYFRKLSNYDGEFNQYMDGRFYSMIRQENLENMDFSKTVTIYQCT
jgi:uncharacterized protein YwqG